MELPDIHALSVSRGASPWFGLQVVFRPRESRFILNYERHQADAAVQFVAGSIKILQPELDAVA
jgi:hypothetical protein